MGPTNSTLWLVSTLIGFAVFATLACGGNNTATPTVPTTVVNPSIISIPQATFTSGSETSNSALSAATRTPGATTSPALKSSSVQYAFVGKWGLKGSGDGQFLHPSGIAVDGKGRIYVADTGNRRIQVFDASGKFLTKWKIRRSDGDKSTLPGEAAPKKEVRFFFAKHNLQDRISDSGRGRNPSVLRNGIPPPPTGLAVDEEGDLYVSDPFKDRVEKFSKTGGYLGNWGTRGSSDGQFKFPAGIVVDTEGNVYVVDSGNARVQKFSPSGEFFTKWNSRGDSGGQFTRPTWIAVDKDGDVYVVDSGKAIVQKFSSGGELLTKLGAKGDSEGQFTRPTSIALDKEGNIYVVDDADSHIQVLSSSGAFMAKWGSPGSGDGQFRNPQGIAVDGQGNIFVSDTENHRIQVFRQMPAG